MRAGNYTVGGSGLKKSGSGLKMSEVGGSG